MTHSRELVSFLPLQKETQRNLLSLSCEDWCRYFSEMEQSSYRVKQVMAWIYSQNELSIEKWLNISKTLREKLTLDFSNQLPSIITHQIAKDGVQKWLMKLFDGNAIETVMIPEKNRKTLCISSQVGCMLNCTFCATAKEGFVRNLSVDEIVSQVYVANLELKKQNLSSITNIVFMGMGEPLLNSKSVFTALSLFRDDCAFGISRRKITISTAGVIPEIEKITNCSLALSFHAGNDELRNKLVPLNKKYPLKELKIACQKYIDAGNQKRHIFLEYVMLKGVNDSLSNAKELVQFAKSIRSKINLIPFNDFANSAYQCSDAEVIETFKDFIHKNGIRVTIRKQRGFDISSACGQLKGEIQSKFKRN